MNQLTEEEKRIAIAKSCGWEWKRSDQTIVCEWHNPFGDVGGFIPNYFHNLNAMHEAEKVLTDEEYVDYANTLSEAAYHLAHGLPHVVITRNTVSPSAAQRAEAFGRVKGLWE